MLKEWLPALEAVTLTNVLPSVLLLAAGVLVARAILKLARKSLSKTRLEKAAISLILSLTKVVLYGLLGLMAASKLGIDVTGVVALASVASLALSLALQDSLSNVIGGFLLLTNHPFHSGDYVEVAGQAGTVQTIDITYTKLTTGDNKTISIPNSPWWPETSSTIPPPAPAGWRSTSPPPTPPPSPPSRPPCWKPRSSTQCWIPLQPPSPP